MTTQTTRTVHIFKDNEWHITPFEDLKKGDIFRMFEEDGEPVLNADGSIIAIAKDNAFKITDGEGKYTYGIECDPYALQKENK